MTSLRAILVVTLFFLGVHPLLCAPTEAEWQIDPLTEEGSVVYEMATGITRGTNGVIVKFGNGLLTADSVSVNTKSGEVIADGKVHIEREDQIWAGEHIRYNFKTRQMEAEQFRTGKYPVFAYGEGLHGERSNQVYMATNAFITADDIANPAIKIKARSLKIIPGKRIEARHAVLYLGDVPVFYFPFYTRNLGAHPNNFNFIPGYRSTFGPYLLTSYRWFLNPELDGDLRLDLREKRGVGLGPDFNYHLGRWGDGSLRYYYLYDLDPNASLTNSIPDNRQRVYFSYQSTPFTNLNVRGMVRYQTDFAVTREFFEGEYRENPQPTTFFEVNKFWRNFSLDFYAQPRLLKFLETVERLPDIRLTGFRQQIGATPLYYESESSAGYYRRLFPDTNTPPWNTNGAPLGLNYEAARADTYHQIVLPETLFGWLNFTPRVGGRFTYYSTASGPGATTAEIERGIFNTGAEVSFKASRVWPTFRSQALEMDGMRHIIEPSVNYVYVPKPNNAGTNEVPQFDYELPSLRLLPNEFPDYNAIDSIDSQSVLRLGLRNKVQTKRNGEIVNVVDWSLYTDWRLRPRQDQTTFADLYSDLFFRPRSWLMLESLTRYDIDGSQFRLALNTLTLKPNDTWSLGLGHWYLRNDLSASPTALGEGNNLFFSTLFLRFNENWGFRTEHHFEARDGRLQEQYYTVYRDFRSWTAALTLRVRDNPGRADDVTVAFTFSLKAFPRFGLGSDSLRPYSLLGS